MKMNHLASTLSSRGGRVLLRTLATALLLVTTVQAEAARFFRYVDENGQLVLSHTIPNKRVKYGYDIVDETARVIQTVAPQLSEADYQAKIAREKAMKACESAVRRVQNLYRSIADINQAEQQALESVDTQITNTKANLDHVRNQREDLESQAAQLDIAGNAISSVLLDNIASAQSQEKNLEEQIELRYKKKLELRRDHDFDRRVFGLQSCEQGLPELAGS